MIDVTVTVTASNRAYGKLFAGIYNGLVTKQHLPFRRVA
jgi:hypothetical protein